jgi:peptidyl-prolyl cis-trans isomerase D
VVVLRMKDHVEQQQQALGEVKDKIRQQLATDQAREKAKAEGEKVIAQLKSGEDLTAVAKSLGAEWKEAKGLKRDDHTVNATIVNEAFRLSHPEEGKSSYGGTALGNGDYVVIDLAKVVDGDASKAEAAQRTTLTRNLSGQQGQAAFNNVLTSLKQKSEIVIEQGNL